MINKFKRQYYGSVVYRQPNKHCMYYSDLKKCGWYETDEHFKDRIAKELDNTVYLELTPEDLQGKPRSKPKKTLSDFVSVEIDTTKHPNFDFSELGRIIDLYSNGAATLAELRDLKKRNKKYSKVLDSLLYLFPITDINQIRSKIIELNDETNELKRANKAQTAVFKSIRKHINIDCITELPAKVKELKKENNELKKKNVEQGIKIDNLKERENRLKHKKETLSDFINVEITKSSINDINGLHEIIDLHNYDKKSMFELLKVKEINKHQSQVFDSIRKHIDVVCITEIPSKVKELIGDSKDLARQLNEYIIENEKLKDKFENQTERLEQIKNSLNLNYTSDIILGIGNLKAELRVSQDKNNLNNGELAKYIINDRQNELLTQIKKHLGIDLNCEIIPTIEALGGVSSGGNKDVSDLLYALYKTLKVDRINKIIPAVTELKSNYNKLQEGFNKRFDELNGLKNRNIELMTDCNDMSNILGELCNTLGKSLYKQLPMIVKSLKNTSKKKLKKRYLSLKRKYNVLKGEKLITDNSLEQANIVMHQNTKNNKLLYKVMTLVGAVSFEDMVSNLENIQHEIERLQSQLRLVESGRKSSEEVAETWRKRYDSINSKVCPEHLDLLCDVYKALDISNFDKVIPAIEKLKDGYTIRKTENNRLNQHYTYIRLENVQLKKDLGDTLERLKDYKFAYKQYKESAGVLASNAGTIKEKYIKLKEKYDHLYNKTGGGKNGMIYLKPGTYVSSDFIEKLELIKAKKSIKHWKKEYKKLQKKKLKGCADCTGWN